MSWQDRLNGDSLAWLLEPDPANPAIRFFALRDLLDRPAGDAEVVKAQRAIMRSGPVPAILNAQHADGYWEKPGSGYGKYRGTEWQIIFLGNLGADGKDLRVRRGCEYLLSHGVASNGGFSATQPPTPSGVIHCLNGNLLHALIRLGWLNDPRVQQALDWQARAITGEGLIQYYQSGTSGADFACAANRKMPYGWGATKAMKALVAVPPQQRSADYPFTEKISSAWFKLGFPLSYWSDVLETLAALVALGYGHDRRLAKAYRWLLDKQDPQGRWKLENALNGKMWADIEHKGQPSKWITLRALRVVKAVEDKEKHERP